MMEPSSSSRSIPAAVVEINNQAALEIENGSYQTAAGMLSSALSTMRDFVLENIDSSQADNEEVVATSSDQSLCFFLSSEVASTPSPLRHRICGTNLEIARGDEHLRFVFREPIRISSKAAISIKSFEILSYAMIYNFALLHHLQASDNSVSSGLQRAVSLYEYAQKLLVSSELNIGLLHTLAIANNLGHAHHYLNHEPTAKLCFQRLLEGIMYATESGDAGKALGRRDLPALDGFFRNVMPLIAEFPAAPAA